MAIFSHLFFTSNEAGQTKNITHFFLTLGDESILLFDMQAEKIGTGSN